MTDELLPLRVRNLLDLFCDEMGSVFLSAACVIVPYLVAVLNSFLAWLRVRHTANKQNVVIFANSFSEH